MFPVQLDITVIQVIQCQHMWPILIPITIKVYYQDTTLLHLMYVTFMTQIATNEQLFLQYATEVSHQEKSYPSTRPLTKSANTTQTMDKAGPWVELGWEDQWIHAVPHAAATLHSPRIDAAQHRRPQRTKTSIMWSSNRRAKNRTMGRE